ncbi:unnamed protein product [Lactuca saligna]|uniref:Uncharacterized protein n=1 Tax=Lactuca saligna TaxID=75948 RepID=A0AA35YQK0_LACSI|nr:unnamed protein product [Lactuca saligna]
MSFPKASKSSKIFWDPFIISKTLWNPYMWCVDVSMIESIGVKLSWDSLDLFEGNVKPMSLEHLEIDFEYVMVGVFDPVVDDQHLKERSRFSDRDGYIVNLEGHKVILLVRMLSICRLSVDHTYKLYPSKLLFLVLPFMMNCFRDNSLEETELTHTAIDKAQCVQAFVSELNPDTNTNTEELPISSSQLVDDNPNRQLSSSNEEIEHDVEENNEK